MPKTGSLAWMARRSWHRRRLRRLIAAMASPVLLTNTPGNVGDQLIWQGIDAALGDLLTGTIPIADITRATGKTLVVPGSGAWSAPYHEWLPDLVASAAGRFARVVVLPSSFDITVPVVRRALSLSNVIPLARELVSAAAVSTFRSCGLGLDCAVYAPLPSARDSASSGELLCLRTDSESAIAPDQYAFSEDNNDISTSARDLQHWIDTIAAAPSVTTDRAHVMIAATLMAKPVRYLEGSYWKVHALADYTFGQAFADRLEPTDLEELLSHGKAFRRGPLPTAHLSGTRAAVLRGAR